MADWGPVVIAVVLFVLLSPGLLFQFPGRRRVFEFGNMQTSGIAIMVHTIIFFGLITIFLVVIANCRLKVLVLALHVSHLFPSRVESFSFLYFSLRKELATDDMLGALKWFLILAVFAY
ncbi:hypothetical protein NC652_000706 [Populus alba x Populus x berolinensis]|nr:hypothetical protein NC652_000706 [Populus alba x Populus x berolinensis]